MNGYTLTLLLGQGVLLGVAFRILHDLRGQRGDHAKCVAHVASVTSNHFAAEVVRELADRYDGMEGIGELTRLRNTTKQKVLEENSIPALWLREQADRIERS